MALNSNRKYVSLGSSTRNTNNPRLKGARAQGASDKGVHRSVPSAASYSQSQRGNSNLTGKARSNALRQTVPEVSSVRIGDIPRDAQVSNARVHSGSPKDSKASVKKRKAIKPTRVFVVIACVVIVAVVAAFALSRTGVFEIENMEVKGADHLTTNEVAQLVHVPQGTTLLNVDVDSIKNGLLRDAWVEDVTVNRIFPSTLQVVVTERQVAAIVEVPVGTAQTLQNWAIAADGMWLMAVPERSSELGQSISQAIYDDVDNALHITGVPYGVSPEIGAMCTDESVLNALEIVDGLTTELADQVKQVKASDASSALLTLDNNVEIAFGSADNIRDKERVCLQIMEENPDVVYINVRVADRPTWRYV